MKRKEQIEAEFRADFKALVDKYKAEIEIKDFWEGYAECREDIKCLVMIDSVWLSGGDCASEYCEFDLGTYHKHGEK